MPRFNQVAGVELIRRAKVRRALEAVLNAGSHVPLPMQDADDLMFAARGAEVLGERADTGTPVFWRHRYGGGQIIIYAAPLESSLTLRPGAFDEDAPPFWRIYDEVRRNHAAPRALTVECPAVAVTESALSDGRVAVIVINHTAMEQKLAPALNGDLALDEVWRGDVCVSGASRLQLRVPAFDAAVFALNRPRGSGG